MKSIGSPEGSVACSLSEALRDRTQTIHRRAERSGIISDIVKGKADHAAYALFIRNLLPVYQILEQQLEKCRSAMGVVHVARTELYRSTALETDLSAICADNRSTALPITSSAERYARHIAEIGTDYPSLLIAHAYVRYMGDLSGGQIMNRLLGRTIGLKSSELTFYAFPNIANLDEFKAQYREAIDQAGREIVDVGAVVDEAILAFQMNIDVSVDVQALSASHRNNDDGVAIAAS